MTTSPGQLQPLPQSMKPQLPEPQYGDRDLIDLPDLIRTLNRYKWSVLAMGLLAAIGAALYAFAATPVYRASLTLLIEAKNNRPIQTQSEVYDPGVGTYEYYASQDEILKARSGIAVASVNSSAVCGGCRMSIRPQAIQELKAAQAPMICENCGRYLYWFA